ncbi:MULTISPECIES: hypothetical protein [unclassified Nostoc]|uniref:hypothetical protein n=1 Tax=unclassified Nostoc TaxID=2593658 RepID=UPI001677A066|nr:hypothetical protein [Nostoc sp. 'Peltigera membranacea cyanobiont' 232]
MTSQETDKIIHYVPGHWGGQAFLTALCGARVVYTHASSLITNCPECQKCRQEHDTTL